MQFIVQSIKVSLAIIKENYKKIFGVSLIFALGLVILFKIQEPWLNDFFNSSDPIFRDVWGMVVAYLLSIEGFVIFYILKGVGNFSKIILTSIWSRILIFGITFMPLVLMYVALFHFDQYIDNNFFKSTADLISSTVFRVIVGLSWLLVWLFGFFADYLIATHGLKAKTAIRASWVYLRKNFRAVSWQISPIIFLYIIWELIVHLSSSYILTNPAADFAFWSDAFTMLFYATSFASILLITPVVAVYVMSMMKGSPVSADVKDYPSVGYYSFVTIITVFIVMVWAFSRTIDPYRYVFQYLLN